MRNKVGQRKCEMWISNNKVLIGGGMKKPHARNPNFETEETKLLISLWGDPKVQKTLITTHKKHPVIAKLAETMREHGYHRSPEEINTRIKNLKCFYNRIKKDIEMGITTEPTWRHYTAMYVWIMDYGFDSNLVYLICATFFFNENLCKSAIIIRMKTNN